MADSSLPVKKVCAKCKEEKCSDEFYKTIRKNRGNKIYLFSSCKKCHDNLSYSWRNKNIERYNNRVSEWRDANRETIRHKNKEWKLNNKDRNREINKAWYEANKERCAKIRKSYYQINKIRQLELCKAWYEANKERKYKVSCQWVKSNPEKVKAISHRRRCLEINAEGGHTGEDIVHIHKLQNGKCAACYKKLSNSYHVDHLVPLYLGGSNNPENLQLLCARCNISKGCKDPIEWAQQQGKLL